MVLEQYSNVKWFTPAKAKAPQGSPRASSPRRAQRWLPQDQAQAPVDLTVTSKPVTQDRPVPVSAPKSTAAVDPWTVYGPTFERTACRGGRSSSIRLGKEVLRNVLPTHHTPQDPDPSSNGRRRIRSLQRQRLVYPSDSALSSSSVQKHSAGLLFTGLDAMSDPEDESGSDLSDDNEHLTLEEVAKTRSLLTQDQDIYFADMPLELLNHIFLDFMCISSDSLHRLAQERSEARTKASQQASASATLAASSGASPNARGGIERNRVSIRQLTNSTHNCRQDLRDNYAVRSHYQHHQHQRLHHHHHHHHHQHRHRHHYREHSSEQGLFQELQSASQASSSGSSSSSSFSSRLGANPLFSETASNLFIMADQDPSYDGEEEEEDNENDTESDSSDVRSFEESNAIASDSVGTIPDFAEDESDSDDGISSEDGSVDPLEETGDSGSHDIDFAYRDDTATLSATSSSHLTSITSSSSTSEDDESQVERAYELDSATSTENSASSRSTVATATASSSNVHHVKSGRRYYRHRRTGARQCCCQRELTDIAGFIPKPRIGINRVDNDLEEDKMLYQLHRDQYFHPTTHTSLRSELYKCSLVNRQWRIAALQLLWQSVVLDSESCRPEPSDPCACCSRPRSPIKGMSIHQSDAAMSLPSPPLSVSSTSSSASSFPTRIIRTRLEAMLDSYLDLYDLDLAKCVQTVELDLRLLVWSAEGESVKRILRRLSPFTHLRLVWAGKESPEEMMTGFKVAMESLHSQIRHLHFFSGFVISPAWTREMAKMTRLHTVTIESLGSLDPIEYDWTRLKCLKLHSVIPRSVFRWPSSALAASPTQSTLNEGFVNGSHHHPTMLQHAGTLLTEGMNAVTGLGLVNAAHADINTMNQGNAWISAQNTGANGWSGSQQQLLPPLFPASGVTGLLSSAIIGTPLHASTSAIHHPSSHPERLRSIGSGWWQWTGLRRLDLQLKNTVLPKEWLQDLTAAIAQNSAMLTKQEQYLHQQRLASGKQALLPSNHWQSSVLDYERECISSYGPPLEVLNIDCEVSHQHKDIFMDLVRVWGHRMEEFHFSHSGELTDEFLWLCLVRMTRLKKLSLRDSKGITGEGVSRRQKFDASLTESPLQASSAVSALGLQGPTSMSSGNADSNRILNPEQGENAPSRKPVRVPIRWRRDFKELKLDQSRVREEFLLTLRQRCPGVVYKVREVRQKTS